MAVKLHTIDVAPGDYFVIRYAGNVEANIGIAVFENGGVRVCGPMNTNRREMMFSPSGVEDITSSLGK